jgi:hypothetical protein
LKRTAPARSPRRRRVAVHLLPAAHRPAVTREPGQIRLGERLLAATPRASPYELRSRHGRIVLGRGIRVRASGGRLREHWRHPLWRREGPRSCARMTSEVLSAHQGSGAGRVRDSPDAGEGCTPTVGHASGFHIDSLTKRTAPAESCPSHRRRCRSHACSRRQRWYHHHWSRASGRSPRACTRPRIGHAGRRRATDDRGGMAGVHSSSPDASWYSGLIAIPVKAEK